MKNEGQAFVLKVPKEIRNDKPTNDERSRKDGTTKEVAKNCNQEGRTTSVRKEVPQANEGQAFVIAARNIERLSRLESKA